MSNESSDIQLITQESTLTDLKDGRVPKCMFWSIDEVVEWITNIGYPEYKVTCCPVNK